MTDWFAGLRELTFASVALRLTMAVLLGGLIGLERGHKGRPAGFRTYLLVCLGAALTMLLGQYCSGLEGGTASDTSRFGAQVINGVGFLGAGTVMVTGHQEIKGLTTAAGLWASACMGLSIGAGFYESVLLAFVLILFTICLLPQVEAFVVENARNMNIYVEFASVEQIGCIIRQIQEQDVQIYSVELDHGHRERSPSAAFAVRLRHRRSRAQILAAIADLEGVHQVEEQ